MEKFQFTCMVRRSNIRWIFDSVKRNLALYIEGGKDFLHLIVLHKFRDGKKELINKAANCMYSQVIFIVLRLEVF